MSRHCSERAEGMRHGWQAPETAQEPSQDDILFRLRQTPEHRSRFAPLKQHRVEGIIRFEQTYRWVTIPKAECVDLVLPFHMRHPELEDGAGSITAHGRRDPRAAHLIAVKWGSKHQ